MIEINRETNTSLKVLIGEYEFHIVLKGAEVLMYLVNRPKEVFCNYYGINSKIKVIRITSGILAGTELDENLCISPSLYYTEGDDLGGLIYEDLKIFYSIGNNGLNLRVEFDGEVMVV